MSCQRLMMLIIQRAKKKKSSKKKLKLCLFLDLGVDEIGWIHVCKISNKELGICELVFSSLKILKPIINSMRVSCSLLLIPLFFVTRGAKGPQAPFYFESIDHESLPFDLFNIKVGIFRISHLLSKILEANNLRNIYIYILKNLPIFSKCLFV